jgi:thiamine biosynthesis lipoprotein
MQAFTADFTHHHIIDPRFGFSSPELASVSVIAPNAVTADALATAVMVMGSEGLKLIENLPHCEAYTVSKELTSSKTTGFLVN